MMNEQIDGIGPWHWPQYDFWGWDHPAKHWPGIKEAILRHTPGRRDRIICAGGCCGMYPRLFAEHFKQVITFEPDPSNFEYLVKNCVGKNIIKIQGGLSARNGLMDFIPPDKFNVGSGYIGGSEGNTPVFALDSIIDYKVDVIQLDCEGGEYPVIKGAYSVINSWWPTLCIENPNKMIRAYLQTLGYYDVETVKSHIPDVSDTVFIRK